MPTSRVTPAEADREAAISNAVSRAGGPGHARITVATRLDRARGSWHAAKQTGGRPLPMTKANQAPSRTSSTASPRRNCKRRDSLEDAPGPLDAERGRRQTGDDHEGASARNALGARDADAARISTTPMATAARRSRTCHPV